MSAPGDDQDGAGVGSRISNRTGRICDATSPCANRTIECSRPSTGSEGTESARQCTPRESGRARADSTRRSEFRKRFLRSRDSDDVGSAIGVYGGGIRAPRFPR